MDKVVDAARRAGIPENVAMVPTPSVVLGVASPHVIDVANAYATFAAQGTFTPQTSQNALKAHSPTRLRSGRSRAVAWGAWCVRIE